jgi:hypothetical protein
MGSENPKKEPLQALFQPIASRGWTSSKKGLFYFEKSLPSAVFLTYVSRWVIAEEIRQPLSHRSNRETL